MVGLLAAVVLAGCGTGAQDGCSEDVAGASGLRLTYRAQGQTDLKATADKLCARVEGLGDERPAVAVEGDTVVVVVPKDTPDSLIDFIGTPGRLVFYDWEPVLLDEKCRLNPDVNATDRSPVVGRARADEHAAKCDGLVVRQERVESTAPEPDAWWVIRDEPVLDGEDIVDPVQDVDQATNEPIVAMRLTEDGRRRFAEVTRGIAQRGADNVLPGQPANVAAHHFAIVLDDELISTPFIDFQENPDGIDGETGVQISGGFTEESARVVARLLELGPLPVPLLVVEKRPQG